MPSLNNRRQYTIGSATPLTLWKCVQVVALAMAGATSAWATEPQGADTRPDPWRLAQATRESLFGDDPPKEKKPASAPSRESLFGDDVPTAKKPQSGPSRDSLFGDDLPKVQKPDAAQKERAPDARADSSVTTSGWRGYFQTDLSYTYSDPEHWSKARARLEIGRQGRLSDTIKYKVTGRFDYDAAVDIERSFYPPEVRSERRRDFEVRETYLDFAPGGEWEFRLGRQHIIWGEVPGLFFADVVSAKDLREFVLQDFDSLRIPQWALRADRYGKDFHFEAIWIPAPTVDRIGKPFNDFFPFPPVPPGSQAVFNGEQKPSRRLSNSNLGLRFSTSTGGWDLSAFAYRSIDNEATFYRQRTNAVTPTFVYSPRHDRITQTGGTLAKDVGPAVLKAEVIYTRNKGLSVQGVDDVDGVEKTNFLDYLVGMDFAFTGDTRLNTYFFQRHFTQYASGVVPDRTESGVTVLLAHKLSSSVEIQALLISSLNRSDWMFRPKVTWNFAKNWRANFGVDVLHGPQLGFFGRFSTQDRVYADLRYSF